MMMMVVVMMMMMANQDKVPQRTSRAGKLGTEIGPCEQIRREREPVREPERVRESQRESEPKSEPERLRARDNLSGSLSLSVSGSLALCDSCIFVALKRDNVTFCYQSNGIYCYT